MAINRYPYKCNTCGVALSKSAMRIKFASVYCNRCYVGDNYPTLTSAK